MLSQWLFVMIKLSLSHYGRRITGKGGINLKKTILWGTLAGLTVLLAGCGAQKNSSPAATSSSSAAKATSQSAKAAKSSATPQKQQYTNSEYAVMGYLKLVNESADGLPTDTTLVNWAKKGNVYAIDFGAHSTEMTIEHKQVVVRYDAPRGDQGMGTKNASKTYTKSALAAEYGASRDRIDQFLAQVGDGQGKQSQAKDQLNPQEIGIMLYQMKQPEAYHSLLGEHLWYDSSAENTTGETAGYNAITANGDGLADLYWQQNGDQITYKYLVMPDGGAVADARMTTETISLQELKQKYYATPAQRQAVQAAASQLRIGNKY